MVEPRDISTRIAVWEHASDMVKPIIEEHSLETYRSGPPFGHTSVFTAVDQHIDHILRVSDWLLDERD